MSVVSHRADGGGSQREGHRPALLLVCSAAFVSSIPGIIAIATAPFVDRPLVGALVGMLGALWLVLQIACGLFSYRSERATVRIWVASLAAIAMFVVGSLDFPLPIVFFPGALLWAITATQNWRGGIPRPGIVERVREQLRKTYG